MRRLQRPTRADGFNFKHFLRLGSKKVDRIQLVEKSTHKREFTPRRAGRAGPPAKLFFGVRRGSSATSAAHYLPNDAGARIRTLGAPTRAQARVPQDVVERTIRPLSRRRCRSTLRSLRSDLPARVGQLGSPPRPRGARPRGLPRWRPTRAPRHRSRRGRAQRARAVGDFLFCHIPRARPRRQARWTSTKSPSEIADVQIQSDGME